MILRKSTGPSFLLALTACIALGMLLNVWPLGAQDRPKAAKGSPLRLAERSSSSPDNPRAVLARPSRTSIR